MSKLSKSVDDDDGSFWGNESVYIIVKGTVLHLKPAQSRYLNSGTG